MKNQILFLSILLVMTSAHAQQSTNTAGGNAAGSTGSVSYSIGQVFFNTFSSTSGRIAQGVQHAYEIFLVDTDEVLEGISITVYPNPTSDILTLNVEDFQSRQLDYFLSDLSGRILFRGRVENNRTEINFGRLSSSIYIIGVMQGVKNVRSFKIIKSN